MNDLGGIGDKSGTALRRRLWRIGSWLAVASALAATYCLYWRPDVAFDLATRIWSCI